MKLKKKPKKHSEIWMIPMSHVTHTCLITVPRFFISSVVHCYLGPTALYEGVHLLKKLLAAGCVLVSMWTSHNQLHNATMANNDNNKTNLLFSVFKSRNRSSWRRIALPVILFWAETPPIIQWCNVEAVRMSLWAENWHTFTSSLCYYFVVSIG